jgi:L-ascorbate metabolism protein UlaG (beta-lactamase superfamily)
LGKIVSHLMLLVVLFSGIGGSGIDREPQIMKSLRLTLIGGATALIEFDGFRLLTDPTFDAPGEYHLPHVTLVKTAGPALSAAGIGKVDAVLLSHDQHADNLDHAGKAFLAGADRVLTTVAGAKRLGGNAEGMAPWASNRLTKPDGRRLQVIATPARHGPAGIEPIAGDVIGFLLCPGDSDEPVAYITGDTVWYDAIGEVARRFRAAVVLPFAGAAQTRGPFHLTMDVNDVIETAHAFSAATIVPLHFNGWRHFTQNGEDLQNSFAALGLSKRLLIPTPGLAIELPLPSFS